MAVAVLTNRSHLLNANMTHANESVPVQAGTTWRSAVIEVDELEELLVVLC